ncbi:MAG: hypothetical protein ABJL67_11575 [Sulfitobacter sp.]
MSTDNGNTPGGQDAKTSGDMTQEFNADNRLAASIAQASPDAQKKIREQVALSEQAMENRAKWQEATHDDRVDKERVRLMEKYMNDPAPRPTSLEARQNDQQIMTEQAERNVSYREQSFLDGMKNTTKSQVYQILKNDRAQTHGQQLGHDQHGHEHGDK